MELSYDFCLLYKNGNDKRFEVIELQTDDILILANDFFATIKEKKLKKAKLLANEKKTNSQIL